MDILFIPASLIGIKEIVLRECPFYLFHHSCLITID